MRDDIILTNKFKQRHTFSILKYTKIIKFKLFFLQTELKNQKRNNSSSEINEDLEQLLPMSDKSSSTSSSLYSFGGNSFQQNNNNSNENSNNNRKFDIQKNQQNNSQNQFHKSNNNQNSLNYNSEQGQPQQVSSSNNNSSGQTKIQEQINQPNNKSGQQSIFHSENNQKQGQNHDNAQRKKQGDEKSQINGQGQQYQQDNKILPNDMILDKGNRDYIDSMIKQKKQGDETNKSKKSSSAKTAVPSFMKGIHVMQQLQQQQQQQMQQALNKQTSVKQQQQTSNDTARINQKQNNSQQQQKNEEIEFNLVNDSQIKDSQQQLSKTDSSIQPSNQDEKLTQRKTIGSQQPKLFDQFFRNNSQHNSVSQTNISNTQQSQNQTAQTQRMQQNQQEKTQNASSQNNQPESKKTNIQINPNSNLQQNQQQTPSIHQIQSPPNSNQPINQAIQQDHQNHHLSTISNNNQNKKKRDSHTSIHLHQSLLDQQQQQLQQQQNQPHHQKKDSSLFNSQQSTLLNNSIGNISPTAQFNNLDQSQFNISNISNIQNVSNNVSSIHNQSNIMVHYNSNNPMNNSNVNSTMSFQKQFEESSPENIRKSAKDIKNNNFLNSLSVFIDYFNTTFYDGGEKSIKSQQRAQNNTKELVQENLKLKQSLVQLEEKLKETETSRKILMGELSREKNLYRNKLQAVMKENSDMKVYLQQINFRFHQTQQQFAKEKIEHDNTKFTLSKVLQNKSMNMQNSNFTNKVDSLIRPQKVNGQTSRKSNSQQFPTQETYINQSSNKLGINTNPMQQYLKAYPYAYQNLIDSSVNYAQGKQISHPGLGTNLYTNSTSVVSPQSNIMNNQQQLIFDGDQVGISRIVDLDEKVMDPLYLNQSQISSYPNQMLLQQDIPMFIDKQYEPMFGVQNQQLNEFDELQCKDFNIDDSNQNIENDIQDNGNMIIRDDFTDNTTDFINLNNQASTMPMQSSSTATGSLRINSFNQQKYGSINNQIYPQGQQILQNIQQSQINNDLQDDVYDEEEVEDMNLSDNFNLDTDNQLNEDIVMMNMENQNKGMGQYDITAPIQQDISIIDNQQYYDGQNKLFNTYDNSNFKFSTHRDNIDQNIKNLNQHASTTYKKGASSLDEEHLYQMMKLQHHPNQYEINRLNLNLKAQASLNANSINQPVFLKSQIKKQQQINPQNRNSYGARTMSLSYQKPQFSSQQFQQFQLFQNQKQKNSFHQQQYQQPYANYQ